MSLLFPTASLGRWLGPWADGQTPRGIVRQRVRIEQTRGYLYEPAVRSVGVYVVLPGLHYAGPDDPRLDRFCRILASAGFVTLAPFVRAFCDLVVDESVFEDGRNALALGRILAQERGLPDPTVFSISFGSLLALDLAASDEPPARAILFGGYGSFRRTVRFALTGEATLEAGTTRPKAGGLRFWSSDGEGPTSLQVARDPLNSPVVFLNLLGYLEGFDEDERRGYEQRALVANAWREMVLRTWGKPELKLPGARDVHAHAVASALPHELRPLFLRGCCLEPGAIEWLDAALAQAEEAADGRLALLDPDPSRVRCPVVLVHGRGDDVIPYFESIRLARAIPSRFARGLHVTGLYGHTGAERPSVAQLLAEGQAMVRMLLALGAVG